MTKLAKLKRQVRKEAAEKGHRLGNFWKDGEDRWVAHCKDAAGGFEYGNCKIHAMVQRSVVHPPGQEGDYCVLGTYNEQVHPYSPYSPEPWWYRTPAQVQIQIRPQHAELITSIEEKLLETIRLLKGLQEELGALRLRVSALEAESVELLGHDPFLDWCQTHQATLRGYSNSYVAIDLRKGIVLADVSAEAFGKKLRAFSAEDIRQFFMTHTSLYTE